MPLLAPQQMPLLAPQHWISREDRDWICRTTHSRGSASFTTGVFLCCYLLPLPLSTGAQCTVAALIALAGHQIFGHRSKDLQNAAIRLGSLSQASKAKASDIAIMLRERYGHIIPNLKNPNILDQLEGDLIIPPKALASDRIKTLPLESGLLFITSFIGFILSLSVISLAFPQITAGISIYMVALRGSIGFSTLFGINEVFKAIKELWREKNEPLDFKTMCEVYNVQPKTVA